MNRFPTCMHSLSRTTRLSTKNVNSFRNCFSCSFENTTRTRGVVLEMQCVPWRDVDRFRRVFGPRRIRRVWKKSRISYWVMRIFAQYADEDRSVRLLSGMCWPCDVTTSGKMYSRLLIWIVSPPESVSVFTSVYTSSFRLFSFRLYFRYIVSISPIQYRISCHMESEIFRLVSVSIIPTVSHFDSSSRALSLPITEIPLFPIVYHLYSKRLFHDEVALRYNIRYCIFDILLDILL